MGWLIHGQAWNLDAIVAHTREHGGGTFQLGGLPVTHGNGYLVGGQTISNVCDRGESDAQLVAALRHFISQRHALLEKPGLFLGTWRDDAGRIHLDVSRHIEDKAEALATAILRKELAIWDVTGQREIVTLAAIQALRDI